MRFGFFMALVKMLQNPLRRQIFVYRKVQEILAKDYTSQMLQPKDKEAYKKFNKLPEIKLLEQRLAVPKEHLFSDVSWDPCEPSGSDGEGTVDESDWGSELDF